MVPESRHYALEYLERVPFFHCSKTDHPIEFELTGNPDSEWMGVVSTCDPERTYLVEVDGDPLSLRESAMFANGARYIYEVQPHGDRHLDARGPEWTSWSYDSATITRLVYRPPGLAL
jgi:hypothetical protein